MLDGEGSKDDLIRQYREAVRENPQDDRAYNDLGNAYYSNGQYEKAIEQYQKAIKVKPEWVYYSNVGDSYRALREWETSITYYQKAVELNPEDPVIHYNLYLAYHAKGMYKEAEESLREAAGLDPENQVYSNELKTLTSKMPLTS